MTQLVRHEPMSSLCDEIIQALSERVVEFEAADAAGFQVADRLAAQRSLLQRFREILAFVRADQATNQGVDAAEWLN